MKRLGRILVALLALVLLVVANVSSVSSVTANGPPPGCNGDIKIHTGMGGRIPLVKDEPKVCGFHLHGFNFDPNSSVNWRIETQPGGPGPGGTEVLSGNLTIGNDGTARTGLLSLPNGMYKVYWHQEGCPGGEKHKVFKVDCPPPPQPAPCNQPPTAAGCQDGLQVIDGLCRNPVCPTDTDCVCGPPPPQPAPCNQPPTAAGCQEGLGIYNGLCRNLACPTATNCACEQRGRADNRVVAEKVYWDPSGNWVNEYACYKISGGEERCSTGWSESWILSGNPDGGDRTYEMVFKRPAGDADSVDVQVQKKLAGRFQDIAILPKVGPGDGRVSATFGVDENDEVRVIFRDYRPAPVPTPTPAPVPKYMPSAGSGGLLRESNSSELPLLPAATVIAGLTLIGLGALALRRT